MSAGAAAAGAAADDSSAALAEAVPAAAGAVTSSGQENWSRGTLSSKVLLALYSSSAGPDVESDMIYFHTCADSLQALYK